MGKVQRERRQASAYDIHLPAGKTFGNPLSILYPYDCHPHCLNYCNRAFGHLDYLKKFSAHTFHQQRAAQQSRRTGLKTYSTGVPNPTRAQDTAYEIYGPLLYIYGATKLKQSLRVELSLNCYKRSRSLPNLSGEGANVLEEATGMPKRSLPTLAADSFTRKERVDKFTADQLANFDVRRMNGFGAGAVGTKSLQAPKRSSRSLCNGNGGGVLVTNEASDRDYLLKGSFINSDRTRAVGNAVHTELGVDSKRLLPPRESRDILNPNVNDQQHLNRDAEYCSSVNKNADSVIDCHAVLNGNGKIEGSKVSHLQWSPKCLSGSNSRVGCEGGGKRSSSRSANSIVCGKPVAPTKAQKAQSSASDSVDLKKLTVVTLGALNCDEDHVNYTLKSRATSERRKASQAKRELPVATTDKTVFSGLKESDKKMAKVILTLGTGSKNSGAATGSRGFAPHSRSYSADSSSWTRPAPYYLTQYANLRQFQDATHALSVQPPKYLEICSSGSMSKPPSHADLPSLPKGHDGELPASTTRGRYKSHFRVSTGERQNHREEGDKEAGGLSLSELVTRHRHELDSVSVSPNAPNKNDESTQPVFVAGKAAVEAPTRRRRGMTFLNELDSGMHQPESKMHDVPLLKIEAEFLKDFAVSGKIDLQKRAIQRNPLVHQVDGHELSEISPEFRNTSSGLLIKFFWNAYNYVHRYIDCGKAFAHAADQLEVLHAAVAQPDLDSLEPEYYKAAVYRFVGTLNEKDFVFLKMIVNHLAAVAYVFREDITTPLAFLMGSLFFSARGPSGRSESARQKSEAELQLGDSSLEPTPEASGDDSLFKSTTYELIEKMDLEFLQQVVKNEKQMAAFFSNGRTSSMKDVTQSMASVQLRKSLCTNSVNSLLMEEDLVDVSFDDSANQNLPINACARVTEQLDSATETRPSAKRQALKLYTSEELYVSSLKSFVSVLVSEDLVQTWQGAAFEVLLKNYRDVFSFNTHRLCK